MAEKGAEQAFGFETMAVVLYCVLESGVVLGEKHYQMMAAVDGKRSASAFQHQFRKVKARAKELQEQSGNGDVLVGTPSKKIKSATATPASKGKKRGKKVADEEDDDDAEPDVKPDVKKIKKVAEVKAESSEDEL